MTGNEIRVLSGRMVDPINVVVDDIDIKDIAHSLAMQCRYNGHLQVFYSVGEHSLYVSKHVEHKSIRGGADERQIREWSLSALLHDAAEAYIGDMVRPLKHAPEMQSFLDIEARIEEVIMKKFNLSIPFDDVIIKEADNAICAWEKVMFRDNHLREAPTHKAVYFAFIDKFTELCGYNDDGSWAGRK